MYASGILRNSHENIQNEHYQQIHLPTHTDAKNVEFILLSTRINYNFDVWKQLRFIK